MARELLHDLPGDAIRQAAAASGRAVDRLDDLAGRAALDEIALRARPDHLQHRLPVLVEREGEDPRVGGAEPDLPGGTGPSAERHPNVDQGHVRPVGRRELDGLGRVRGLADQDEARLALDQLCQSGARARVILGDQNLDGVDFRGRVSHS